jgi:hypothetical protein
MEARLVVVYEDARCDVHGIDKAEALLHPASVYRLFHIRSDVHKAHSGWFMKGDSASIGLHRNLLQL